MRAWLAFFFYYSRLGTQRRLLTVDIFLALEKICVEQTSEQASKNIRNGDRERYGQPSQREVGRYLTIE